MFPQWLKLSKPVVAHPLREDGLSRSEPPKLSTADVLRDERESLLSAETPNDDKKALLSAIETSDLPTEGRAKMVKLVAEWATKIDIKRRVIDAKEEGSEGSKRERSTGGGS